MTKENYKQSLSKKEISKSNKIYRDIKRKRLELDVLLSKKEILDGRFNVYKNTKDLYKFFI
ncbi:MAG: hypothetical protein KatS3mg096_472 [Candidatus Parcubacteria bacterium]|nr:MAG: hypothetical protein KatS3mg096_472 [Candidatus Parcubacteria bacterium]